MTWQVDRAMATGNVHKNLVNVDHVVREISSRTGRHTHDNTLAPPLGAE